MSRYDVALLSLYLQTQTCAGHRDNEKINLDTPVAVICTFDRDIKSNYLQILSNLPKHSKSSFAKLEFYVQYNKSHSSKCFSII